jgi:hypothetical protein
MLNVTQEPFMLSVNMLNVTYMLFMLSVIGMSVIAPKYA